MLSIQPPFPSALLLGACAFTLAAAWIDCREHRIPNRLVLAGLAVAALGQGVLNGGAGLLAGLAGLALGLALLLPFHVVGAMGAGDVKLLGMVGAFLGPAATLSAAVLTLLAGGALAVAVAMRRRALGRAFTNARTMLAGSLASAATLGRASVAAPVASAGKLPYGVAIAAGTVLHVALTSWGVSIF